MPALGDTAFQARIEGIAGEEGQDFGLIRESRVGSVVVHDRLKAGDSSYRFSRPGSGGLGVVSKWPAWWGQRDDSLDVVDIVVVDQAEVRTTCPRGRVSNGEAVGFKGGHSASIWTRRRRRGRGRGRKQQRQQQRRKKIRRRSAKARRGLGRNTSCSS